MGGPKKAGEGGSRRIEVQEPIVFEKRRKKGGGFEVVEKKPDLRGDAAKLEETVKGGERAGSLGEAHEITVLRSYIGGHSNQKFDSVVLAASNDAETIQFALAQGLQRAGMAKGKLVYCKPEDVARMKEVIANPDDLLMQIK